MKTNNPISIRRIGLLIRNDIQRVGKMTGMVVAAVLFVSFFAQYLPLSSKAAGNPIVPFLSDYELLKAHYDHFGWVLFLGGVLFTSYVLADLNAQGFRQLFLMLPASSLEKVGAKWVLTGLIFPVLLLFLTWLFVLFSGWVIDRSLGLQLVGMSLFDGYFWRWVGLYMGLQPIFFLGAITFHRFAAVKTFLAMGVAMVFLSIVFSVSLVLLLSEAPYSVSFWDWVVFEQVPVSATADLRNLYAQAPGLKLPYLLIMLSPLFLLISFHKFKEKEIVR